MLGLGFLVNDLIDRLIRVMGNSKIMSFLTSRGYNEDAIKRLLKELETFRKTFD